MAGPAKKRAVQPETNQQTNQQVQEEIEVDFEGRNPEGEDYHGIKQLLNQLFLKAHIDLSQLSDMLIQQAGIGSVLKQSYDEEMEDDEDDTTTNTLDVFGITSVLNITAHKETPCVVQLLALLKETSQKHADETTQQAVQNYLSDSKKIGLIINERFVNIPAKISDPLLTSLADEIGRKAKRDDSYKFDYYIMICKLHKPKSGEGEITFSNGEEELFDREALAKYEFDVTSESDTSVSGKWTGDVELIPYRRILFIDAKQFPNIVASISNFVN